MSKLTERVEVPLEQWHLARRRISPIVRTYWHRQGCMNLEHLTVSCYLQALQDVAQLMELGLLVEKPEDK